MNMTKRNKLIYWVVTGERAQLLIQNSGSKN